MGTRSTYRFIETYKDAEGKVKENKIALVYFQYDGYPDGHPLGTAEWLASGKVVNGLGVGDNGLVFNGAGCLTAQFIAKFKDAPGNVYIHPLSNRGKCWENYLYDIVISQEEKTIKMIAYENLSRPKKFFEGTPAEFVAQFTPKPKE